MPPWDIEGMVATITNGRPLPQSFFGIISWRELNKKLYNQNYSHITSEVLLGSLKDSLSKILTYQLSKHKYALIKADPNPNDKLKLISKFKRNCSDNYYVVIKNNNKT